MNNLKMYTQDYGWRGCIYCIAHSEEEAREFMSADAEYVKTDPVIEEELIAGWIGGHCAA